MELESIRLEFLMELKSIKLKNQRLELEFHRLEFQWKILFFCFALFTPRGPIGLLCFALFFPVELEFHRLEFHWKIFFSWFCSVYSERSKRVALFFSVFSSRTRVSQTRVLWNFFFFFVLLCFPLLIPGIIHCGIFFFFFPGHADKPETETCACTC